jgi:hypothetical protein
MKKRKQLLASVVLTAVCLLVVGWLATRPVVVVTQLGILPAGTKSSLLRELRYSREMTMPGGSRGYMISLDQKNTAYALGIAKKEPYGVIHNELIGITTTDGATTRGAGKVVPLQQKQGGILPFYTDAFVVSPSGQHWWTAADSEVKQSGLAGMKWDSNHIVRQYRADGTVLQEWITPADGGGVGQAGAVGEDTFYTIDEGNKLWVYKTGQRTPHHIPFVLFNGSIDWRGQVADVGQENARKKLVIKVGSPLDKAFISEERPDMRSWPEYELQKNVRGFAFWHDPAQGTYIYEFVNEGSRTGVNNVYNIHRVSKRGEVHTLMHISAATFAGTTSKDQFGEYQNCQWLKADGDAVIAAVVSMPGPGERIIRIVQLESVPRWRSWFSRQTGSGN